MIPRVFVHFKDGVPASRNLYDCWNGFRMRGHPVEPFEDPELGDVTLTREDIVAAGISVVHRALVKLGVDVPASITYPEALRPMMRRRVWNTTLGRIRADEPFPVFIKPSEGTKVFNGLVVYSRSEMLRVTHVDDAVALWASETCHFLSEWRVYVLRGEILGVGHYNGDPLCFPDSARVRALLAAYRDAPVAFSLDVGVLDNRATDLVEVNDAYALGNYGIPSSLYAQMIEARWMQLVGGSSAS